MRDPQEVFIERVRADALGLLEKVRTTSDPSARRRLARRAFELAQFAAMEAIEAVPPVPQGILGGSGSQATAMR